MPPRPELSALSKLTVKTHKGSWFGSLFRRVLPLKGKKQPETQVANAPQHTMVELHRQAFFHEKKPKPPGKLRKYIRE